MKIRAFLIIPALVGLLLLFIPEVYAQNKITVVGQIEDEVILKTDGEQYLIQYRNNNVGAEDGMNEFTIENKTTLDKLYQFLMDGFESMNPGPVQFELDQHELRLYYQKRFLKKDVVEIIHEDKKTEMTGTVSRLKQKDIDLLFGIN